MEKKYVSYLRLSKESNRSKKSKGKQSNLGIDAQRHIINHYYGDAIICEFTEIKSGASMDKRLELQKAIRYVRSNPGTILVVAKQDRLSRDVIDVLTIHKELNGQLVCCDIPNGDACVEPFMLTLFAAISQRERELISIRTKQALAEIKRTGGKLGTRNIKCANNFTNEQRQANASAQHESAINDGNTQRAVTLIDSLRQAGKTWQQISIALNAGQYHTRNKNMWTASNAHRVYTRAINHMQAA